MIGLGIETSCDETSVALVKDGTEALSIVVYSQIAEHAPYRGVVPELASRSHLEKMNGVFAEALSQAQVKVDDIDYVAVTNRPGLMGSLMIGAQLARSIELVHRKPIVNVDHVEAHFYAMSLERGGMDYPSLGLILSGGNSTIYQLEDPGRMIILGDTMDDACGEAFDKVASIVGLPYPGGPHVEKEATLHSAPNTFPKLLRDLPEDKVAFSFSGLKTAALRAHQNGMIRQQICHDFQESAFELIERMLLRAIGITGIRKVYAAGGVLANGKLRENLKKLAEWKRFELYYPQKKILCTDNAGMIAALGYYLFKKGNIANADFAVSSKR